MAAFRRAELTPVTGVDLLNASAQDIDSPALTVPADDLAIIESTWKQDDYSANSARSGFTPIGGVSATAGDDAAFSWWYQIQTDATDLATATHTITGGGAAISRASIIALEHAAYLNEQTDDITPTITEPWLKSVARPFLNQPVTFGGDTFAMERPARRGVFDVVGRSLPVAVSDVRSSRRYSLRHADRGYVMSTGRVVMHGPADELAANEDISRIYLGSTGIDVHSESSGASPSASE
jgi:hypothetical protein